MILNPVESNGKRWQETFEHYSNGLNKFNMKIKKISLLLSIMSKHVDDSHFFFLTSSCITSLNEKTLFIQGILKGDFSI